MPFVPEVLKKGIVQPKYILAIVIVLMGLMVGMGLYELSASNRDILRVLQEEATSLAESISIMSDNSLMCFDEINDLVSAKLLSNARILENLDYLGCLDKNVLSEISNKNKIRWIGVFDKKGRELLTSNGEADIDYDIIAPVVDGTEAEFAVRFTGYVSDSFIVGVHRRKGGAVALTADVEEIINFRRSMGIGRLIQAIGENEGIEYIVLQDEAGLILASKNVTEIRKIAGDSFLENALENKSQETRKYSFGGEEVLEVVSPFQIDEESYGLFRIGLSMKEANSVESRSRQRLVLTSFAVFVAGIVSLGFLLVNQNYSLLSRAYEKIQTYTGMVLENVADGIIVADSRKVISVFNRASERIFKKSSDRLIGSSVTELSPSISELFSEALNGQTTNGDLEIKVKLPEAGSRLLSVNTSQIAGDDGGSVIAVVRDITETKLMEENIRRTEQLTAMGKLASAVAHEVRNPLNAISMIAQRLNREFAPKEDEGRYRELVSTIKSESLRLNGIIEEFLKFARPPKLNRQPVDINQMLDETISLIKTQAEERGIEVVRDYSGLGVWTIDREQMKQVFLNLFLNALEAMPDGGFLSVKAMEENGMLSVEVSDTGKGIPEEDLPRIFDLYFTTKDSGTGLGLSIVQRVIMEHRGWISVNSTPDKGTTFRINIPGGERKSS